MNEAPPTMNQVLHRFAEAVWELRGNDGPITSDRELRRVADIIRERITLGAKPNCFCMAVCVPLASYLQERGIDAQDVHGAVGEWQHSWVALPDGRILDPTADQFNSSDKPRMPRIYLGPRPSHYETPR